MSLFLDLHPELFYQIALHLPLTKDVLAFSLTHSRVHDALSTPALPKARLALQGWDVTAWKDEDYNAAQYPKVLERWMRIDHTYCRTAQLFEQAAVESYFHFSSDTPVVDDVVWGRARSHLGPYVDSRPTLDGEKTAVWLRKLSEVLPMFITHHRGGNISRITEARHRDALWAYTRVVADLCSIVAPQEPPNPVPEPLDPELAPEEYGWFERACFSLIALLMQCDANTVTSIFNETWANMDSPLPIFEVFWMPESLPVDDDADAAAGGEFTRRQVSKRYFASFFIQTISHITLHLAGAHSPLPLCAPELPHITPATFYDYDEPFELGTSPSLRPWLRDGLAGTPLAGLSSSSSSSTGRAWAGYYTVVGTMGRNSPMFLELRSAQSSSPLDAATGAGAATAEPEPGRVYFRGDGYDGVGTFTLEGTCDARTGAVTATKAYIGHQWEWRGTITPFGMVGMWGPSWSGGWWWIWPREWSPVATGDTTAEPDQEEEG